MDVQQLEKLKKLKDKGIITEEEFQEQKRNLLFSITNSVDYEKKSKEKEKHPILSLVVLVSIFIFVARPFINGVKDWYEKDFEKQTQQIPQNILYQQVSIPELMGQLKINAARAQKNYKGKYVEFSGILSNIDADGDYFNVETGEFITGILCYLKDSKNQQIIINKNIGSRVHVKGQIRHVGEVLGYSVNVISVQ